MRTWRSRTDPVQQVWNYAATFSRSERIGGIFEDPLNEQ